MEQIDLSGFFTTRTQASDFSTRLAGLAALMYDTHFDLEKILLEQLGIQKKDKFITLLRHNNIPLDSNFAIKAFIERIKEKISTMPVMTLTIAFEPKEVTLKAFAEWFLINTNKQVLLDVRLDKEIIGGAIISVNGKFFDFSVRPQFNSVLKGVVSSALPEPAVARSYTPLPGHQSTEHITLGR
jgi:F0F1-type ATP synthase delta subunit